MGRDGIAAAWVEAVITQPEQQSLRNPNNSMPDPADPALTLAWRRISEFAVVSCGLFIIEAEPIL